jgi:predicted nucleic-acid-binding protein
MQKVDANIVLRYVLDDHAGLSPKAKEIIDNHIVEVPVEILCEVVYVLNGYYEVDRTAISIKLKEFFEKTSCILSHREAILKGLEYFGQTSLDFADCILAGYAEIEGDVISTFDNKLQNFITQITNRQ